MVLEKEWERIDVSMEQNRETKDVIDIIDFSQRWTDFLQWWKTNGQKLFSF